MENNNIKTTKDFVANLHEAYGRASLPDAPAQMLRADLLATLGSNASHVTALMHDVRSTETEPYNVASVFAEEPNRTTADVHEEMARIEDRVRQELALHDALSEELKMREFAESEDDDFDERLYQPEEHEPDPDPDPEEDRTRMRTTRILVPPGVRIVPVTVHSRRGASLDLHVTVHPFPGRVSVDEP